MRDLKSLGFYPLVSSSHTTLEKKRSLTITLVSNLASMEELGAPDSVAVTETGTDVDREALDDEGGSSGLGCVKVNGISTETS